MKKFHWIFKTFFEMCHCAGFWHEFWNRRKFKFVWMFNISIAMQYWKTQAILNCNFWTIAETIRVSNYKRNGSKKFDPIEFCFQNSRFWFFWRIKNHPQIAKYYTNNYCFHKPSTDSQITQIIIVFIVHIIFCSHACFFIAINFEFQFQFSQIICTMLSNFKLSFLKNNKNHIDITSDHFPHWNIFLFPRSHMNIYSNCFIANQ